MARDARRFKRILTDTVTYVDDQKMTFGTDTDLEIYHTATGNTTYIDGKNSRPVYIRAKDFYVTNGAGTEKAISVDGAVGGGGYTSVKLYYDDVEKFKTSATGFEFTGTPTEGLNNLGTLSTSPVDIDLSLGNIAMGYCDGTDITFTFSGYDETVGNSNSFTLILVSGSTQTITWPAFTLWTDGTAPTLSATNDVLTFVTTSGSLAPNALWLGFQAGTAMAIP
jgi:hypothetical protein